MNSLVRYSRRHLAIMLAIPFLTGIVVAQDLKPVTLQDVFGNREFYTMGIPGLNWMNDGEHYAYTTRSSDGVTGIFKVDAASGKETLILNTGDLKMPESGKRFIYTAYEFSSDERYVLFTIKEHHIWRHSYTADYIIYDLKNSEFISLPEHAEGIRNIKFSPDGKILGYVLNDDIHVYTPATKTEVRLTNDAQEHVFNGRFGWVYEEEFGIIDGWRWAPDSKSIAYWQEDERGVPEYTMTDWMPTRGELISIRYPKAGDPNPIEKIGVVSLSTRKTKWMDIGEETDIYIPRIYWTNDASKLCIIRMNRLQNELDILMANTATGASEVILSEKSETGWIEIEDDFVRFLKHSDRFIWASERTGFKHLYLYDYQGKLINPITSGNWEVTEVTGMSNDEKRLYYVSTEVSPLERHLYSVRMNGKKKAKITKDAGYHTINMAPGGEMYLDNWSSTQVPGTIAFYNNKGKLERMVTETSTDAFSSYLWQPKEISTFTTSDGVELYYSIIKPANFDASKKYPVYVDVYGGPGYQAVTNRWPSPANEWVASEGFIYVQVDNRGGGARGTEFKHWVYKQLGKWESHDYIEMAKHLATFPYVDAENIGIWGWSYGGYMSSLTLLLGSDYYKAAVSIAPVTDWKLYDTIYAERYMQRPQDNPEGYREGSCIAHAKELEGNLLLIHGGLDDNVHVQNTMQYIDALESAGKTFDMRIYPNGNHGVVTNMQQRFAMYTYYMDFFKSHLQ